MAQKLWYFRYFLLFKKSKLSYKKKLTIIVKTKLSKNKRGEYKSELNWNYIKSNNPVDIFFDDLLENNVSLIDLKYLNLL